MGIINHMKKNSSAGLPVSRIGGCASRLAIAAFGLALAMIAGGANAQFVEIGAIDAPTGATMLIYSPSYNRLLLKNAGSAIATINLTSQVATVHASNWKFADMSRAPGGRYVLAADYGGENTGYGTPANQGFVHRVDLLSDTWDTKTAGIAGGIQAVSDTQFLLKSLDQWVTFTNNSWGSGPAVEVLNSNSGYYAPGYYAGVYSGTFLYHQSSARILHGNNGLSSSEIQAFKLVGNEFQRQEGTGSYGSAQSYGGSMTMATDGSAIYYGKLQVDPLDVTHTMRVFPEIIYAATGDIAFGASNYYNAHTGSLLGSIGFTTTVYGLNPNGTDFWAYDSAQNKVRHFSAGPVFFGARTNVPLNTVVTSSFLSVSTINASASISIVGGMYSINGGAFTASAGIVNLDDKVTIQLSSSANVATTTTATLTIGGVSGTFSATTVPTASAMPAPPAAPSAVAAVAGNASARVSFAIPASNGGSTITGYTVTSSPSGIVATGASSPITVSGLTNNTSYTFTVVATNAAGVSIPSTVSNSVSPAGGANSPYIEIGAITAPTNATQLLYATAYNSLLLKNSASTIAKLDLATGLVTNRASTSQFTDMSLSPGGRYVFAADYGGENIGYGTPASQSYVHRLDLFNSVWQRKATNIAGNIQAVSSTQFVLKSLDQWITFTNNYWGAGSAAQVLNSSSGYYSPGYYSGVYAGNFVYQPGTGRLVHGSSGISSQEVQAFKVVGSEFQRQEGSGTYGTAQGYGGSIVMATDGNAVYYGRLKVDLLDVSHNLRVFPEIIYAATADIAFGNGNYYDARTGALLGSLGFATTVYGMNSNGADFWAFDSSQNKLRHFALERVYFPPRFGVALNAVITSNSLSVNGINGNVAISIVGGSYSVNGGAYTANAGTVNLNDKVTVQLNASGNYSTATSATLTIGGASGIFSATTLSPQPDAPTEAIAVAGRAKAKVSFMAPVNVGGHAITGYTVTASPGGMTASGASSPITVTGLTNGVSYSFTVVAINGLGVSVASNTTNSVTPFLYAEIGAMDAPTGASQLIYSSSYNRLLLKNAASAIATINLTNQASSLRFSNSQFTDMSLAPGGRYAFAADYGNENIGYGTPASQSYVHRVDLSTTAWEAKTAPIAGNVQAVSDTQFLLKSLDQWVTFTNNAWGSASAVQVLNANSGYWGPGYYAGVYRGDFRYHTGSGRILHGNTGSSSAEIQAFKILNNDFQKLEGTGSYGSAQNYGANVAMATDGSAFYYGRQQVNPLNVTQTLRVFPEIIYAATADIAFGSNTYYDARTGVPLGSLGLSTTAFGLNQNGQDFWIFDAGQNKLRHFSNSPVYFGAMTGVARSVVITSGFLSVIEIDGSAPISITGGMYSINGGAFTANPGTVNLNDKITVQVNSSSQYATSTSASLTIGSESGTFQVTTLDIPPAPPTAVTASAGNARATISFDAPAPNGGSPVTSYKASSNPGGFTAVGTISPLTVTGLSNGVSYTFTVTATNGGGTSLPSSPSNSVTPVIPVVPGAPAITAVVAGHQMVTVYFSAPTSGSGSITNYTATCTAPGQTTRSANGIQSPLIVPGLRAGVQYSCSVMATNNVGNGPASVAATSTPMKAINITPVLMLLLN
ncbi:hypothetical protein BH11PSE11_BH11PSE11_36400 [soil metagenome]